MERADATGIWIVSALFFVLVYKRKFAKRVPYKRMKIADGKILLKKIENTSFDIETIQ